MDWIKSAGGPLICVERDLAISWRGVASKVLNPSVEAASDYDRACAVRDYAGVISVGGGSALILGDMPLETSIWERDDGNVLIVRLFYVDSEESVLKALREIDDRCFENPDESISFEIGSGKMVIFDSAISWIEEEKKTLEFEVSPAKYLILSKIYNPDSRTSLLLHEFVVM